MSISVEVREGVIAIAEFGLNKYTTAVAAVLAVGALQMVQNIPVENEDYIDQALFGPTVTFRESRTTSSPNTRTSRRRASRVPS